MKAFCIPVSLADKLKRAAQTGEIKIEDLYEMTSEQRRELFKKYTDTETARLINTGFEESIVSSQKDSLKKWAEKTFVGEAKKTQTYKDVLNKIEELDSVGVIDPKSDAFLEDLAATKLGLTVSKGEVEKLVKFSEELEALKPASDEAKFGISMEYLQKRREINNYIESLTPSKNLKVGFSLIGRGMMLLSFKSPFLNIHSNTIGTTLELFTKRVAKGQYFGVNGSLAVEYSKFAIKAYMKTGFDITRMLDIELSPKALGEDIATSQGPGAIRAAGRVVEDLIFNKTLGTPDVAFSALQFSDTANLQSTLIARKEGLKGTALKERARILMEDAMRLDPKTPEGIAMRKQAVADAAYATYQNSTLASKIALNIRKLIDDSTGNIGVGEALMPFVKTPANVLSFGFDYSVGGAAKGAVDLKRAFDAKKEGNAEAFQEHFENAKRNWVRAGLGLSLAFLIAAWIKKDEFIGSYPTNTKERELMKAENGVANSIKIGDKWISLDYFGALGTPLMGYLYAKKFGNNLVGQATNFLYGELNSLSGLPGYDELRGIVENINDRATNTKKFTAEQDVNDIFNGITDFISSRIIPGGVGDLAKIIDTSQREVDYNNPTAKLFAKIPFLSKTLKAKTDILGNELKNENPISTLLFGARVKTANESAVIKELERLKTNDALPALSDPRKTSDRFIQLKEQLRNEDKFNEAYHYYQIHLSEAWEKEINSSDYKKMDDQGKMNQLNSVKTDMMDSTLNKYNYRKPRETKK